MLRTRAISAAVLVVVVGVPAILGGWPFLGLIALVAGLGAWEFSKLFRQGGYQASGVLTVGLSLLFIAQARWPELLPLSLTLTLAVLASLLLTLWHRSSQPASDWSLTLTGALYVGWLLGHAVSLRALPDGLAWLALAVLMVWAADVSAYFAGRAFGRHPWWPRHSPKKTWEGYLSGVLAATLVAAILARVVLHINPLEGMVLGAVVGVLAPLGDLAESMVKRQVGAKDSSNMIPGHGGILDRIDTMLITIPLVFYWATLVPRFPM